MKWYELTLILFLGFNLFFVIFVIPFVVYLVLLVRTSKTKWQRGCSMPEDETQNKIFSIGMDWYKDNESFVKEVHIKNGKYNLYGQYFDFGYDKSVIILPGRMESLMYSYFFASPYKKAGYNVLTIDQRSHGLSDGIFNSLGYLEHEDTICWAKFLKEEFAMNKVVLHGICIGASNATFTVTSQKCPDNIKAVVTEGMYVNFYQSCKNHMISDKRIVFPTCQMICFYLWLFTGLNAFSNGPLRCMNKMKLPILMLQSKEDKFSLVERATQLFDKCTSEVKDIVYFEKGEHSRIRLVNQEKYDQSIIDFLKKEVR